MSSNAMILDAIKKMSVIELSGLVKAIEQEFGVSAAAPAAVAAVAAVSAAPAAAEKTEFKIILKDSGAEKIKVIKALRAVSPDLGLKEAKDAADNVPFVVREAASKDDAAKIKKALEEAGAKVDLV